MIDTATPDRLTEARNAAVDAELRALEHHTRSLTEALELWDKFVSFDHEELLDDEGMEVWSKIGLQDFVTGSASIAYKTDSDLAQIRNQSRHMALHNEFAINALENRTNYVIGQGHQYEIEPAPGQEPDDALIELVGRWFEGWRKAVGWHKRQQEIMRRLDRDGEAFIRYFPQPGGHLLLRFVEPEKVLSS